MRIPLLVATLGLAAPSFAHADAPRGAYIRVPASGVPKAPSALPHAAPTIFYINHDGATYRPGVDDAAANTSSIIESPGTIPPWNISDSAWNEVKSCFVDLFSRWNVEITDVDPGDVPHYEISIGGQASDIGMPGNYGGVSPWTSDCSVIPNSIVYVFAEVFGNDYQVVCEVMGQEIAHSFGLDHEYLCSDPMTYLTNCGEKTFQDIDVECGEYEARACSCPWNTQNSVDLLNQRLGVAAPNQAPTVAITSPGNGASMAPGFAVAATASDDVAVTRVEFTLDGAAVASSTSPPYGFTASGTLTDGDHTIEATAFDADGATATDSITVTIASGNGGGGGGDDDDGDDDDGAGDGVRDVNGGCTAGGGAGLAGALSLLGLLGRRRRRSS